MPDSIFSRFKKAVNVFRNVDEYRYDYANIGPYYSQRIDRPRFTRCNEASILNAVFNRIALDVAAVDIRHVRVDEQGRYQEDIDGEINDRLHLDANLEQTGRAFIQDVVISMFDEGCVGILPVDVNIDSNGTKHILSWRTAKILDWAPDHVRVNAFDHRMNKRRDITVPKTDIAIIENPFYAVMNEGNSVVRRLIRKMNLLDIVDEQSGSGKMDLIIQLPYTIKTTARKEQAEKRRADIENQLANSKYGIAYADATEHITQLNRSLENNMLKTIEYLNTLAYSQLGITTSIMDGTADEKTMLNYTNRTIEPIVAAIAEGIDRTFITKTARAQGQKMMYFRDPFRLVPLNDLAEIADKFTRNEIMTSNEFRSKIGMPPSDDPKADQLINSNISQSNGGGESEEVIDYESNAKQNKGLDGLLSGDSSPDEDE